MWRFTWADGCSVDDAIGRPLRERLRWTSGVGKEEHAGIEIEVGTACRCCTRTRTRTGGVRRCVARTDGFARSIVVELHDHEPTDGVTARDRRGRRDVSATVDFGRGRRIRS